MSRTIEFYLVNDSVYYMIDGRCSKLTEQSTDVVEGILNTIRERYPSAYNALSEEYRSSAMNVDYYRFLMVRRFCKCNFGSLDVTSKDIDNNRMNMEKVCCPMRGECKIENIVCNPRYTAGLSSAETRVMHCIYNGKSIEETADVMNLSSNTIKNHIKSAFAKIGVHEKAEFIRFADEHAMFSE